MTPLHRHQMGAVTIESPIALPGVGRSHGDTTGLANPLRIATTSLDVIDPPSSAVLWNRHGQTWRYVTATAQFDIADNGQSIVVGHLHHANRAELQRLLVDHVIPRALVVAGHTVLHATAVQLAAGALAFIGASGAGKSTMAMHFVKHGAKLLADDALIIEQGDAALVVPTQSTGRLWPDSAAALAMEPTGVDDRAKHWVALSRVDTTVRAKVALTAVIVLERNDVDEAVMHRCGPVNSLWALSRQTFGGQMNGCATADLMKPLRWMAEHVPVFHLSYPSTFEGLDRTRHCIVECMAQSPGGR
jgi:hypothetical protein